MKRERPEKSDPPDSPADIPPPTDRAAEELLELAAGERAGGIIPDGVGQDGEVRVVVAPPAAPELVWPVENGSEESRRVRLECIKLAAPTAVSRGTDYSLAYAEQLYRYVMLGPDGAAPLRL